MVLIAAVSTPMLFLHGVNDDYIPPQMSEALYAARQVGARRLYLAPGAAHAEAYWNNREEYERKLGEFLREIGML